jgi:hypothetical protein
MSLDYSLFLRDQPDVAIFADDYELEIDGDDILFAGFRMSIREYEPADDDPLAGHPWQQEIKWVLSASGRHADDTYDDFVDLMAALGERHGGGLWCDHGDGSIEWYGWDRERLASQAMAWGPAELVHWLDEGLEAKLTGPREQVAEISIGRLASFTRLQDRQAVLLALWRDSAHYAEDLRAVIGDALLEVDARTNDELRVAQLACQDARAVASVETASLPTTRDEIVALVDAAATSPLAERLLLRGIDHYTGSDFVRGIVGEALLARARTGAAQPSWAHPIRSFSQLANAPERTDPAQRAAFSRRGPFARAIAAAWDESDAWDANVRELIERRRRGGELFAGIPDDIRALATTDRAAAVDAYANRYGLPRARAAQVVDANL